MSTQSTERLIIVGLAAVVIAASVTFLFIYGELSTVRVQLKTAHQQIAQLHSELDAARHVIAELETLPEHGPKEHWLLLILAAVSYAGFLYLKTKLDWMRDDVTKLYEALKMKPPNRQPPDDDLS